MRHQGKPRPAARWTRWLAALGLAWGCGAPGAPDAPIVLISVDTLRADHLGAYGYPRDTTPRLDAFFSRGTRFENAMNSSPCTVPSVRQTLSGGFDVRAERKPLAEILRDHGYATAAVVSQHQFHADLQRDYARGFEHFDIQARGEVDAHGMSARTADEVSERALAWLERSDPARPFLLWLHYFDPHDPYEPPAEHRQWDRGNRSTRSGDRRLYLRREKRTPAEPANTAGYVFSAEDVDHFVNLYDGEVRFVDAQLGRVLDALEGRGLGDTAIVALLSDHGEWLGENDWWDHCMTLREPEVRMPLLVRVRGGPLAGRARDRRPASSVDLLPTLLAAAGVPLPSGPYHGADLRTAPEQRVVFAFWQDLAVARTRDWKLVASGTSQALFHLAEDPGETRDLRRQRPRMADALVERLRALQPLRARVAGELAETVRQLRALGYVE